jgi:mRNA-degrading endonuclease RelE of RelBE toxin-antitoxin system
LLPARAAVKACMGHYRIICDLQDWRLVVLVIALGDGRDIYRRR